MALRFVENDSTFEVEWQGHFTITLLDTPSNRQAVLVFLRSLVDEKGKHLFTFRELSMIFHSHNRQASSQHMEDFRNSGGDFLRFLTRKRKVDTTLVEAVTEELLIDPLASIGELREKVNARLGREDITEANITGAVIQRQGSLSGVIPSGRDDEF